MTLSVDFTPRHEDIVFLRFVARHELALNVKKDPEMYATAALYFISANGGCRSLPGFINRYENEWGMCRDVLSVSQIHDAGGVTARALAVMPYFGPSGSPSCISHLAVNSSTTYIQRVEQDTDVFYRPEKITYKVYNNTECYMAVFSLGKSEHTTRFEFINSTRSSVNTNDKANVVIAVPIRIVRLVLLRCVGVHGFKLTESENKMMNWVRGNVPDGQRDILYDVINNTHKLEKPSSNTIIAFQQFNVGASMEYYLPYWSGVEATLCHEFPADEEGLVVVDNGAIETANPLTLLLEGQRIETNAYQVVIKLTTMPTDGLSDRRVLAGHCA